MSTHVPPREESTTLVRLSGGAPIRISTTKMIAERHSARGEKVHSASDAKNSSGEAETSTVNGLLQA
jgi:hypothetical protein